MRVLYVKFTHMMYSVEAGPDSLPGGYLGNASLRPGWRGYNRAHELPPLLRRLLRRTLHHLAPARYAEWQACRCAVRAA